MPGWCWRIKQQSKQLQVLYLQYFKVGARNKVDMYCTTSMCRRCAKCRSRYSLRYLAARGASQLTCGSCARFYNCFISSANGNLGIFIFLIIVWWAPYELMKVLLLREASMGGCVARLLKGRVSISTSGSASLPITTLPSQTVAMRRVHACDNPPSLGTYVCTK